MERMQASDIVLSSAGHDRGKAFIVVGTEAGRVLLVDGKTRKLSNPKMKSLKHLCFARTGKPELAEAMEKTLATDRLIRKELAIFRSEAAELGGS